MRSADDYRDNALECFALATRAADPHSGYILRGVANSWLWMAEQAEKIHGAGRVSEASHLSRAA